MKERVGVPSVGEVLVSRFLEPNGISQYQLAKAIGKPTNAINRLVNGKVGLTPEMAVMLSKALGTSPEYWMEIDTAYQLANVKTNTEVTQLLDEHSEDPDGSFVDSEGYTFTTRTLNNANIGRAVQGAMLAAGEIEPDQRQMLLDSVNKYFMYRTINVPGTDDYIEFKDDMPTAAMAAYAQFLVSVGEDPREVSDAVHSARVEVYPNIGRYDFDGFELPANARHSRRVQLDYVGQLLCGASQLGQEKCSGVIDCLFAYTHDRIMVLPDSEDSAELFKTFLRQCGEGYALVESLPSVSEE
jgi:addiction module HigA family antidote